MLTQTLRAVPLRIGVGFALYYAYSTIGHVDGCLKPSFASGNPTKKIDNQDVFFTKALAEFHTCQLIATNLRSQESCMLC